MYIEDLIQLATSTGQFLFSQSSILVTGNDYKILESISNQIFYNNNHLTEKQATLVVKLLKKNRDVLRPSVPNIDQVLENPQWKYPFRIIPSVKRISISSSSENSLDKQILVEFPYDDGIVTSFRRRNSEVHDLHKGQWDSNLKKWSFNLTEPNILWLGDALLSTGFATDDTFISYYQELVQTREQIETFVPMLTLKDGAFEIVNSHSKVPQPETDNLAKAVLHARDYGIGVWDDSIEHLIDSELNPVLKAVVKNENTWFNSETISIEYFKDLFLFGGPVLIVVPGGSELEHLSKWTEFALSLGFTTDQVSVMFRLPNEKADFNAYVKEMELNSPVTDDTQVVFVSTKITKPLVKSGIKFRTAINLGYYNYMHFTMNTMVENTQNLVYYSMKEPTHKKKWQPREL